jgi:spore maturation protein CgeB
LLNRILDSARLIVAPLSEDRQQCLLDHLTNNLITLASKRPQLIHALFAITEHELQNLAILEDENLGFVLYEQRQGQWLALTSQASALQRASSVIRNETQQVIYFLGVGFGEELVAWHRHSETHPPTHFLIGYLPAIFLIEPVARYFLLFLLTGDRRALLADARFYAFVGAQAFADYQQLAQSEAINYSKLQLILSLAADRDQLASRLEAVVTVIAEQKNHAQALALAAMRHHYDAGFALRMAQKIKEKRYREIKVLGITSCYTSFLQYCTRDLLSGFADLGCQIDIQIEANQHYFPSEQDLVIKLHRFLPDIVFSLDSLRLEVIPKYIPYHTWIQDELERLVNPNRSPLTEYDFVDVLGSGWQQRFAQRSYYQQHRVGVLPLGFYEGTYFPIDDIEQDIDVLYVSHLTDPELTLQPYRFGKQPQFYSHQEQDWLKSGGTVALLSHAMTVIATALDRCSLNQIAALFSVENQKRDWLKALKIEGMTESLLQLLLEPAGQRGRIGNDILSQLKYRPMQALIKAGVSVALYGKYWHAYSDLAPFAQGVAANGDALNQLHNRSKICINNSAQVSFHMRAVEIIASRAFMLSRRIPLADDIMPITQLFAEGTEIILFADESDLIALVRYYLAQPELRQTIAQAAMLKLHANHAYRHRAQQILDNIALRFPSDVPNGC